MTAYFRPAPRVPDALRQARGTGRCACSGLEDVRRAKKVRTTIGNAGRDQYPMVARDATRSGIPLRDCRNTSAAADARHRK